MKRSRLNRRTALKTDPDKQRAWERRCRHRRRSGPAARPRSPRKQLPRTNPARLRRLRAQQFGTDGKRSWIMRQRSALTRLWGHEMDPIDPAHVLGTRASGAGPEGMAPLRRTEHTDFDSSMTDKRFATKYNGRTREDVRQAARRLETEWQELKGAIEE